MFRGLGYSDQGLGVGFRVQGSESRIKGLALREKVSGSGV
jgi:hypothetical protein